MECNKEVEIMPSPIKKYTSGTFRNRKGVVIKATKRKPVYAYKRDGKKNKGGWTYTKPGNKRYSYRVSIVGIGTSHGTAARDRGRGSQNPYPVSPEYRHTGDWVQHADAVRLSNYPRGMAKPPKKAKKLAKKAEKKAAAAAKAAKKKTVKKQAKAVKRDAKRTKKSAKKKVKVAQKAGI